ncbi:M48 family metallopeptidase [Campylobacter sp.]|uniref:M48 family metallopeptidase n=1 Tax=Campylobacter sp. TaxID=205 RepID=UPI002706902A|nr:SprT family zinc-dependent metalloprotease [Campylobacter sp.]
MIDFLDFKVFLKFTKRARNIRLKINKQGKISCSLPFYITQKTAINFLNTHKDWLVKTHEKISANLPKDDEFCLLGKIYKIKFDENLKAVLLKEGEILTPNLKRLEEFKKSEAKRIFNNFIDKFSSIINRKINRVVIRKMQTRWGSCNWRKGYINLNLNLIEKESELIEYVVLHELTHLIYPHHQSSFYEFLKSVMSDFKEREKRLNNKNI